MAKSTENKGRVLPNPEQVRGARGMLKISQQDLADAAGVSRVTVERYEQETRKLEVDVLEKIADALERRGIRFTNGNRPTVIWDKAEAIIPRT